MVVIIVSEFSINIAGRINNFNLPKNQPLLPLFEAIVNSFHAIEERRDKDKNFTAGEISIKIIRGDQIGIDENDLDNITGFEICDNGVGFDENNFKSFLESDSTYKAKIGGKGVGRFSWLKAFEEVEIQSVYKEYDDKFVQRSFCFRKYSKEISDVNKAALSDYVAHRKIIIDLLSTGIRKIDNEKFSKEEFIHNLIFPMKYSSDDIDYESHNLWLIDERLAYSSYVASDVSLNTKKNDDRPDLLLLDNPIAVSDQQNDGTEFDTITIFELKRPMRNDYSSAYNPITQLYKYVDKIKDGKVRDINGRPVHAKNTTRFYLYAVCDITTTLEKVIKQFDFIFTPNKIGYYKMNETYNTYVEILPFDKMINDSKKRNRILFEKLGL